MVPGGEKAWPAGPNCRASRQRKAPRSSNVCLPATTAGLASLLRCSCPASAGRRAITLLEPKRMQRFYTAMRGRITSPGPARPVFRANTDMMLLTQRLRIEPDGKPHIPGNLEVWKNLFVYHPHGKYDGKLTKAANGWKEPDDLIEALFALCRKAVENEPLKIYMAITDLNRYRVEAAGAGDGGPPGPGIPALRRRSIRFSPRLQRCQRQDHHAVPRYGATRSYEIRDHLLQADTAGTMQALVGPVADLLPAGIHCRQQKPTRRFRRC